MTLASLRIVLPFTLLCMLFIPLVQGQEIASCEDGEFLTLKETGLECSVLPDSGGSSLATPDKNCPDDQLLSYGGTGWVCISFPNPPAPPTLSDFVDIGKTVGGGICKSDEFLQLAVVESELKLQCAKPPVRKSGIPEGGNAGQVLTKSAELESVWADVETPDPIFTGYDLFHLLEVEKIYTDLSSFSASDVSLVDGNTRINLNDAREVNIDNWLVVKEAGENNDAAVKRGNVAKVISRGGGRVYQSYFADFDAYNGAYAYVRRDDSAIGQLTTQRGVVVTGIEFMGSVPDENVFILDVKPGYIPSNVSIIQVILSAPGVTSRYFNMNRSGNRFKESIARFGKEFIKNNNDKDIAIEISYNCNCIEIRGDFLSQIKSQDNVALIEIGAGVDENVGTTEGINHSQLSFLPAERTYTNFPSFSSVSSTKNGNTRIYTTDIAAFDVNDWVVVKKTGESGDSAIKRRNVTRVVYKGKTTLQNYSAKFILNALGNYRYSQIENQGALNKNATSATEYGISEESVFYLGMYNDLFDIRLNGGSGYLPESVKLLHVILSTSSTNFVEFDVAYDSTTESRRRFIEAGTQLGDQFIEANNQGRIFVQLSYDCVCVELEGNYASQIKNKNNAAFIETKISNSALKNPLPGDGVEGQVLTKTAESFAWAGGGDYVPNDGIEGQVLTKTADGFAWAGAGFTGYDLLSLILVGKRSISFPSFSTNDVSLTGSNTKINVGDTIEFNEGDWVVIKQSGESNEEAMKRGSVTRVRFGNVRTTLQNYSVDFDYDSWYGSYTYNRHSFWHSGTLNKDATSATEYGTTDAEVVYMGISANTNPFFTFWTKQGYVPSDVSSIHVTLSTSSTNSVSLMMTKGRDYKGYKIFGDRTSGLSESVAKAFIKANERKRIFVEMTYICSGCVEIAGDYTSEIQNQNNVTLIKQ